MFKLKLGEDDANKKGLIVGLGLPKKYQTRLGVVRLFNKLEETLSEYEDAPEDFTVWPVTITFMPCRRSYVYKGPDDFPLENVFCRCNNPKHRPIVWSKKPSKPLQDLT